MNEVFIGGRLLKDIEIKRTKDGRAVTTFALIVERVKPNEADYIDCVAWNALAEKVETMARKGDILFVHGRLSVRTYEKNGEKRHLTEVIAKEIFSADDTARVYAERFARRTDADAEG